jgi:hypothetical protein
MRHVVLSLAAILTFAETSPAAVLTFTNSAAFFSTLGLTPHYTETFEGPPVNSTISSGGSLNGITYNFSPASDFTAFGYPLAGNPIGRIDNNYVGFGNNSLAVYRDPVSFGADGETPDTSTFYPGEYFTIAMQNGDPLYAVGVFLNADPDVTQPGDFYLETGVGTVLNGNAPEMGVGDPLGRATMYFLGLISDTPFYSAEIGSRYGLDPLSYRWFFNADNLTVANQQLIPEPTTFAVLGGLVGVGGWVARRRRTTAATI